MSGNLNSKAWRCTVLGCAGLVAAIAVSACSKKPPVAPRVPPVMEPDHRPPPPPPPPVRPSTQPQRGASEEDWFATATLEDLQSRLGSVYFQYDSADLEMEVRSQLEQNAQWLLKPYSTLVIEVEGHCDERGTTEYNLALGERRSMAAADYLRKLGVPRERLRTVSYGKERPECIQSSESCWWKNRRAYLRVASRQSRSSDQ